MVIWLGNTCGHINVSTPAPARMRISTYPLPMYTRVAVRITIRRTITIRLQPFTTNLKPFENRLKSFTTVHSRSNAVAMVTLSASAHRKSNRIAQSIAARKSL